jgi:putative transcriptional regulator
LLKIHRDACKARLTPDTCQASFTPVQNRVRELRTSREHSQGELAQELGVSRQTINAIETGRYLPSLPLALRIGQLFGEPVEDIFELEDGD